MRELGSIAGWLPVRPGPPPRPFRDYIRWLDTQDPRRSQGYWRQTLAGVTSPTPLGIDRAAADGQGAAFGRLAFRLTGTRFRSLRDLAKQLRVTPFTLLEAAWALTLSRYSGRDDVVFGVTLSGRPAALSGVDSMVGCFINTLPVRIRLPASESLRTWLESLQRDYSALLKHQHSPLTEAQRWSGIAAEQPLFESLLAYEGFLSQRGDYESFQRTNYPLAVMGVSSADDLEIAFGFDRGRFEEAVVARMLRHLEGVLGRFDSALDKPLAALRGLPAAERHQLLVEWNGGSEAVAAPGCTIHQLIEAQVDRRPDAVAVVCAGSGPSGPTQQLSYRELDARANQVAHHLRQLGVGPGGRTPGGRTPEGLVGVYMERSVDMVVALLGILKAGAAYLPLDLSYPEDRLTFMLEDAGAAVVLSQQSLLDRLPDFGGRVVCLDGDTDLAGQPQRRSKSAAGADDLAYVIYTSGSTGRPKGVLIPHRQVVRLVAATEPWFAFDERDVWTFFHSHAFDFSVWEIWGALATGGRLVAVPYLVSRTPAAFHQLLSRERVTVLNQTPSAFRQSMQADEEAPAGNELSLREVIFGGEALEVGSLAPWFDRHGDQRPRLVNMYGITETTVHVTYRPLSRADLEHSGRSPIGRAIPDLAIHLLDRSGDPVPIGVPGEMCVGGAGLARGYLARPGLTAERFVPDPFRDDGSRLYRSGDLARYLPDGDLEFLGRIDHQVKVRGFRIELGEIEAVLCDHPALRQAVVLLREHGGSQRLVAHVSGRGGTPATVAELRDFASSRLPEVMVPSAFDFLDALPLTANGKVDRGALARRVLTAPQEAAAGRRGRAPRTPVEDLLAGIWSEMLSDGAPGDGAPGGEEIGLQDNFFDLGGHSLLVTKVASRIRQTLDVELPLERLFKRPTLATLAAEIEALRGASQRDVDRPKAPPIRPLAHGGETGADTLPLSFAQERLWFIDQLLPDRATYNIPGALRLSGPLSVPAFVGSLDEIVRRHQALRTHFRSIDGQPRQVIAAARGLEVPVVDLSGLDAGARDATVRRLAAADAARPFDLATGPLLRVTLLRLQSSGPAGDEEHTALFAIHHIVSDGWSVGILLRELATLYGAFVAGRPSPLPELPIQYADFAVWQRAWLSGEELERQLGVWRRRLAGASASLDLPADRPRSGIAGSRQGTLVAILPATLHGELTAFSRRRGVTPFMTLLTAFQALLSRLSGQLDVVVGSPIANRNRLEIEDLIGFFVNTLVLRGDLSGGGSEGPPFRELLDRTREVTLEAYAHQDLPFEKLVDELAPKRSLDHTPLFQVMMSLQAAPEKMPPVAGLRIVPLAEEIAGAKFDLNVAFHETREGLVGIWGYRRELLDGATVRRWTRCFESLLRAALADPETRLGELPLLSAAERQQMLVEWNEPRPDYAASGLAYQRISERGRQRPGAVAAVFRDRHLTYGELDERSDLLDRRLRRLGVGPEVVVGVCLERSLELVIGLLAIHKAGGAYLPLDPTYPAERLGFMVEDSGTPVVVTTSDLSALLPATPEHVLLDQGENAGAAAPVGEAGGDGGPPTEVRPENPAYLIYTSGSTGRPKGVAVSHRALLNRVLFDSLVDLAAGDGYLQFAPFGFDMSVNQIFGPLLAGGRVVLLDPGRVGDPSYLARLVAAERSTHAAFPPVLLESLLEEPELRRAGELRQVVSGGEALSQELPARFHARLPGVDLINRYGPTEATVAVTSWTFRPGQPDRTVPIGRPMARAQIYLLDRWLRPVPAGVPGELFIGGPSLARGYWRSPALTAERFLPHPLPPASAGGPGGGRIYRTGDLARYRHDGAIEFLGRVDHQVKIRGFRVELGEIEAVLRRHPAVREAAVVDLADGSTRRLAAYFVTDPESPAAEPELRQLLRASLPDYMVPSALVELDQLPRTPAGKVDRSQLPTPERPAGGGEAPSTPAEELVAGIWSELLRLDRVGRDENFFELGGHSLLATQAVSRIREAFRVELPLRALFESPTVAGLAEKLDAARRAERDLSAPPLVPVARPDELPLSFAQERLWFLDRFEPESPLYNIPFAVRLKGRLAVDVLAASLDEIVRRHETLRTSLPTVDGRARQVIAPELELALPVVDLSGLAADRRAAAVRTLSAAEAARPFDLGRGPLLRATLLRLDSGAAGDSEHVALFTMHHIVSDAWSMQILVRELAALYGAYSEGKPSPLPELPVQYADFAAWQRTWLRGEPLDQQLSYWRRQLAGSPALLELPTDRSRPAVRGLRGATATTALPTQLLDQLRALSRRRGVTLFITLLAAFQALLSRLTGQREVPVGSPIANRNRLETEGLIGFFVNTLVLRGDLSGNPTFEELLARTREVTLEAHEHQDLPFEKLVNELVPERSLAHSALFQVMLVLQNEPAEPLEIPGLTLEPLVVENAAAKFDLTLTAVERSWGLGLSLRYNSDIFAVTTIRRMLRQFRTLLSAVVADPRTRLADLPLLSRTEHHQLLVEWHQIEARRAPDECLHRPFEAQAARTPEAVAVVAEEASVSYGELNASSNRLAHHLRAQGVGPETLVGVYLERSVDMVVAILGILKAGGAYVSLDPGYPAERLAYLLKDARMRVVVTEERRLPNLPQRPAEGDELPLRTVCLDSDRQLIRRQSAENPAGGAMPDAVAYVIYTSGSTGKPKGVVLEHRQVVSYVRAIEERLELIPGASYAMVQPLAVDSSKTSIYPPLYRGGCLHLISEERALDARALAGYFRRHRIDVLKIAPSHLAALQGATSPEAMLPEGRLIVGGEASRWDWTMGLAAIGRCQVFNHYGPTEATVGMLTCRVGEGLAVGPSLTTPIGRPLPNARAHVLDRWRRPVAPGVAGELAIGGACVARGYLDRPRPTAASFVPDPFAGPSEAGARLYRTGDLVRHLADGNLEFLGRVDHQVKIRGFRIEPGEIEATLCRHPAVREAIVVKRQDRTGNDRLVGYLVAAEGLQPEELRAFAMERLPKPMIPAVFVILDALPRTPHGKVDRKRLPEPGDERPDLAGRYVPPRTPAEQTLVEVWAEVLGIERIGTEDNFFELGGDSILSIQVISRAKRRGLPLHPQQIFQHPTVAALAAVTDEAAPIGAEQGPVTGPVPLTPVQRLFFEQLPAGCQHWNQAFILTVPPIDAALLEHVVEALLAHHDALRMRFLMEDGDWRQNNAPPGAPAAVTRVDLSAIAGDRRRAAVERAAPQVQASLDLARGPLWRVAYFEPGPTAGDSDAGKGSGSEPGRLLLVAHHLVIDGVTWRILLEDFERAYRQLEHGADVELDAKTTSYKEWAERLEAHAGSAELAAELPYWLSAPRSRAPSLPVDRARGDNTVASVRRVSTLLGADETEALLRRIAPVYRTHIDDVLLTALTRAVARWTGEPRVLVDLEGHGRNAGPRDAGAKATLFPEVDLSRTVGWFTTVFPVVLELDGEVGAVRAAETDLKSVKEQLREIPGRGFGYGLLRYLGSPQAREQLAAQPRAEIGFNYLGQLDAGLSERSLFGLAPESAGPERSPGSRRRHLLDVTVAVAAGRAAITWIYSSTVHRRETIEALAEFYLEALRTLIAHCLSPEAGGYTPSDFPLARLDQATLDRIAEDDRQVQDLYPLSPLQQGILLHTLVEKSQYVEQMSLTLRGRLDVSLFRRAWQRIVDRHGNLRTGFLWRDLDQPLQMVHERAEVPLTELDWRACPPAERRARLESLLEADREQGFELFRPPLLRLTLIRLEDDLTQIAYTYHHLILDGWSTPLLLREIFACYRDLASGERPPSRPVRPFRDYIAWLAEQDQGAAEVFWRPYLAGFTSPTPLATQRAQGGLLGAEKRQRGRQSLALSATATRALQAAAQRLGLTLNTLVQGAWALALWRYSGEADVVFGATVSGRSAPLAGLESMLGLFINTLPVRARIRPRQSAAAWLDGLQRQQAEASRYESSSLVQIQGWSEVPRTLPLFESLLVFENYPVEAAADEKLRQLGITEVRQVGATDYPLALVAVPRQTLSLTIGYDARRFDGTGVRRMLGHLRSLLEGMATDPERRLQDLPLLTRGERQQLLVEWNEARPDYPQGELVHERFAALARRSPAAVALTLDGDELTYGELNARANRLAHHLDRLGVGPEILVGVCLERSFDFVVSVLAVLKAGGAYVPLDPAYPTERLAFMVADAGAPVVITAEGARNLLPQDGPRVVVLDRLGATLAGESGADPESRARPENPAYVIYTSGSTGLPKGVMIPHRALIQRLVSDVVTLLDETSRFLSYSPLSFDMSLTQTYSALMAGGRSVLMPPEHHKDVAYLAGLLRREGVTHAGFAPVVLEALLQEEGIEDCSDLRQVITGGEAAAEDLPRKFYARLGGAELLNRYGPTEATVAVTSWTFPRGPAEPPLPIGRPIAKAELYVLDRTLRPLPVGIPGELHIGGVTLARGYLGSPALTAEKFVPHPFVARGQRQGRRLYRTGDLVRARGDGAFEFLGRIDHQVKIRGFRVELGEVEAALRRHPAVRQAAVVDLADHHTRKLVAYLVPERQDRLEPRQLRDFLVDKLPDYMVPSAFVTLESLPLGPTGKVDRDKLPAPGAGEGAAADSSVAPRNAVEEILTGIWAEVLDAPGSQPPGIHDDFFALGGHSLMATRVVSRIRQLLGVELPLRRLFEEPTVAALAQVIAEAEPSAAPTAPIVPVARDSELPLSFSQERLWFLDQLGPVGVAYVMSSVLRLEGRLSEPALIATCDEIVRRHQALRTIFAAPGGRPVQVIRPPGDRVLAVVDLRGLSETERRAEIRRLCVRDLFRPFDLARGPLLRVALLRLAATEHVAVVAMHHIVADGWSIGVFVREVAALYRAFVEGEPSPLAELPIQYADFAAWQRQWLSGEVLESQLAYWRERLADLPEALELPTDRPRPPVQTHRGGVVTATLPTPLVEELKALGRRQGATLFMTLLAAFATLLHRLSGQDRVVVGTSIAGRDRVELEGLIGLCLNNLPLSVDLSGGGGHAEPSFAELLSRVREMTLGAYAHQHIPFERLVEEVQPQRKLNQMPIFQVILELLNAPLEPLDLPGVTLSPVSMPSTAAKLDLTLTAVERPWGLAISFNYLTDLFDAVSIRRLARHLEILLQGVVADPESRLGDLPWLSAAQRHQLRLEWNQSAAEFPRRCLHELFEAQVARTPDAVAVVFEDAVAGRRALTFEELNRRANRLAHHLRDMGVGPEVLVGLYSERSLEMVVGLWAILKAGGAYLPLDPTHPPERLTFMLEDAGVSILLGQQGLVDELPHQAPLVVYLDDEAPASREDNLGAWVDPDNLAYVIYTSGSTGRPKGVEITHLGLVNYLSWCTEAYEVALGQGSLVHSSLAFDLTVTSLFAPLLAGKTVRLVPEEGGPEALATALRTGSDWSLLKITPAHLDLLSHQLPAEEAAGRTRAFVIGGEALSAESLRFWQQHAPESRLINEYGPTETVVGCCVYEVEPGSRLRGPVAIGRPIANARIHVLDRHLRPLPVGAVGELCIGGPAVARGYHHRPALTAEKFVADPCGDEPGARLYRTGDLARYRPTGELEFLGRRDQQVKIRGFRIELGEIEAVLLEHPAVREAVVCLHRPAPGDERLIAYLVADEEPDPGELRAALKRNLPDYMVPSTFLFLDRMPLAASGKVKRSALPPPEEISAVPEDRVEEPRDSLERELVRLWEEVLGRRPIGIREDFFDLGGHSLLGAHLIVEVQNRFGHELSLTALFQGPTVEAMAAALRQESAPSPPSILVPLQPEGDHKPFFCVHAASGDVLCYRALAQELGTDQPFYGLQSPRLIADHPAAEEPWDSVEDIAQGYIDAIRTVQAEGPYFLGGWSFGGVVAFEMAQQLVAQGQRVDLVALLDTSAIPDGEPEGTDEIDEAGRVLAFFETYFRFSVDDLRQALPAIEPDQRLAHIVEHWRQNGQVDRDFSVESMRHFLDIHIAHERAARRYVRRPYPGQVTLFRARDQRRREAENPTMGWDQLAAGGVTVHAVAGRHQEMIFPPLVESLARELKRCLDSAPPAADGPRQTTASAEQLRPPDSPPEEEVLVERTATATTRGVFK
ncbi:MAG: non-ribosomal peptide synthase/polyketide synthase [Thermoanaerobaculia bacterium]